MEIELGKKVIASDGENLGIIDRLVLDTETHNLRKFVVHKGVIFGEERIVDIDMISNVDAEGNIHLDVSSNEHSIFPVFVEERFRAADDREMANAGFSAIYGPIEGIKPVWYERTGPRGSYEPGDQLHPGSGSFFKVTPPTSLPMEIRDNLPADTFTIDEGTEVVDTNGDKIGEVLSLLTDEHGNPTGFIIESGFIFKREVRIPISAVEHLSGEHVMLNITGDEAESRYGA